MDEILRLEHLEKTFGTHQVLRDISFSVNKGDVISIIVRLRQKHNAPLREPARRANRRQDHL